MSEVSTAGPRPGVLTARRLTALAGQTHNPCFSPDGRSIAFQSDREGAAHIYLMGIDGSTITRLTDGSACNKHPAFSPDGRRVAWDREADGVAEILVADLGTRRVTQVTGGAGNKRNPAFSPDGRLLAYDAETNGSCQVCGLQIASGHLARLSPGAGPNKHPAFSPDGRRAAYVTRRTGTWELCLLETGEDRERRVPGPSYPQHPAFHPREDLLVVQGQAGRATELFFVNPAGDVVQVTNLGGVHKGAFSPDGRSLAFSARVGAAWEIFLLPLA